MEDLPFDPDRDPGLDSDAIEPDTPRSRRFISVIAIVLIVVTVLTGLAGAGLIRFQPTTQLAPSASPDTELVAAGMLAVVDPAGAIVTMDAAGGSPVRHEVQGVTFAFPAWSPDGTRFAAIGTGIGEAGVYVFSFGATGDGTPISAPTVIYRNAQHQPFYLYWTPDSSAVTFLTNEPGSVALRQAPADASGPDTTLRRGTPMYWTWVNGRQLLVHSGSAADSFLGEIGLDGTPSPNGTPSPIVVSMPGMFRAPAVAADGRYVAYVRARPDAAGEVVVEARDASSRHAVAVFGPAAVGFDPTGDNLAFIGRAAPGTRNASLPVGPLRLLDALSGSVRTLLDGAVVAFFWAPDGRTIAALRVIAPGEDRIAAGHVGTGVSTGSVTGSTGSSGFIEAVAHGATALMVARGAQAPAPASAVDAIEAPSLGLRLVFIDIASGAVRSQRTVHLTDTFVSQLLPFFDQYALSHRLWSPDGTSLVLPAIAEGGAGEILVVKADGSDPVRVANGSVAFWRP